MASKGDTGAGIYKETLLAGLWRENPVFRLLLGMCPTLAVTAAVKPALTPAFACFTVASCKRIERLLRIGCDASSARRKMIIPSRVPS